MWFGSSGGILDAISGNVRLGDLFAKIDPASFSNVSYQKLIQDAQKSHLES